MERITNAHLDARIALLNAYTKNPDKTYTQDELGVKSNVGNYHLSCAYGKYTLHQVHNERGGISEPLGSGHIFTKRELFNAINLFLAGIKTGIEQQ